MLSNKIYFKSEAGGTTILSRDTTANSGNLALPEDSGKWLIINKRAEYITYLKGI